jgi:1,4-alpha-glucan branching enzyme
MVTVIGSYAQFRFFRPQASRVYLAGDFNGWKAGDLQMVHSDDGNWIAVMRLPAGNYKFRYWADGQWFCDYAAFGVEPGPYGMDSIVHVPLAEAS